MQNTNDPLWKEKELIDYELKAKSKHRMSELIKWSMAFVLALLIIVFITIMSHAQSGSIVPKQDTISPQVSHNAPYSYFPVYSFDTTK